MTSFWVQGHPMPQGSKRHVGKGIMVEVSNVKPWRDSIAWEARNAIKTPLLDGIWLKLVFQFKRPKGHYGTGKNAGVLKERFRLADHTTRPDLDKLCRAVGDALTGIAYRDDSQVVVLGASKVYASMEDAEGVRIEVQEMNL